MGAAKRRGSFEQRKAEAVAKAEARRVEIEARWKKEAETAPQGGCVVTLGRNRIYTSKHMAAALLASSLAFCAAKGEA